jgi:hypothetical protein
MSQGNTSLPTTGTVSGLTEFNTLNAAFQALQSMNSGAAAPANDISGAAVQGQEWLDTSTAGKGRRKVYDGVAWLTLGVMDTTNHLWQPMIGGGSATLASATTVDLGSVDPAAVTISGTTTITSFGSSAGIGQFKFLKFSGALTLTYNATSLILPTGANLVTSAGDSAIAKCLGSGNWEIIQYTRASGAALTATLSTIPFPGKMHNGTLVASVASNAMTIALKTLAGADPSAGDAVLITVPTLTGGYALFTITAALSVTIPSGATVGTVSGQANRIWVGYSNNSGTHVLSVYNCLGVSGSNYTLTPWREEESESGTSISSGSGSAAIWYSSSAFSGLPVAILGYVESTQATAGTWASTPSKVMLFGPATKKPGESVQRNVTYDSSAPAISSTTMVVLSGKSVNITPKSAANLIHTKGIIFSISSGGHGAQVRFSRGTTANTNLFGAGSSEGSANGVTVNHMVEGDDLPNTTGTLTYQLQGRSTNGATITWGFDSGSSFGVSMIDATEIQI